MPQQLLEEPSRQMIGSAGQSDKSNEMTTVDIENRTNLKVLCDFTNKSLEGELADQELC
jgi:hypothetical protein